jgi:hypothetical protein
MNSIEQTKPVPLLPLHTTKPIQVPIPSFERFTPAQKKMPNPSSPAKTKKEARNLRAVNQLMLENGLAPGSREHLDYCTECALSFASNDSLEAHYNSDDHKFMVVYARNR